MNSFRKDRAVVFSLILVFFLVGIGVGFYFTPEYALMKTNNSVEMMELGPADQQLDLRYVNGMIAHHLAAIHLSQQALASTHRNEIRNLAHEIIVADEKGIAELYAWKKAWYNDTQEITEFRKVNLGSVDANFDLRFLNALIAHHDEAIEVAKEVQTKSTRNEVLNSANKVILTLTGSKTRLTQWRKDWYGIE